MSAAAMIDERVTISEQTAREAHGTSVPRDASLVLKSADGKVHELPPSVERALMATLRAMAEGKSPHIGTLPEQLTSTVAADLLGVSRPTLMKWVKDGEIEPFKVGSHNRFHRDEVLALKAKRKAKREEAFDKLRALEDEQDHLIDD
ncbi:helix-turn-helix domain-containing protein [Nesterenkonia sp. K-15-9-6]|uniref:helix-turn-helix domain-containing protein n=1 Tax=Nesterenkonia sp. K-15-9-6 TaxID=3093918 RepID=UPI0040450EEB